METLLNRIVKMALSENYLNTGVLCKISSQAPTPQWFLMYLSTRAIVTQHII